MEGMLNYYKANYPREPYTEDTSPLVKVQCPTLVIHGLDEPPTGKLEAIVVYLAFHGEVPVQRLRDEFWPNSPGRQACDQAGLKHKRTRPYTPRTNGKAERFIQTLQREWAYGKTYKTSAGRRRALLR